MRRFPLVHAFGAPLPNDSLGIANDAILMASAHPLQQLDTGDPSSAGTVQYDLYVFDLLLGQLKSIQKSRSTNHGCAMLVVMEDGDIAFFLEPLFDDEAFRSLYVFQVNAPKSRAHQPDSLAKGIHVLSVQLDIYGIDVSKTLEQDGFAFHHRLRAQSS